MDFSLTEEQTLLQGEIDRAMARASPLSRIRRAADDPGVFPDDLWTTFQHLGLPSMLVPVEFGGLGLGCLDAVLVSEILGKHAVAAPFLGPVIAAPMAIALAGSADQKASLLPRISNGELRIALGLSNLAAGRRDAGPIEVRAGRLSGGCTFVVDHVGADMVLVADSQARLWLVETDQPGCVVQPLDTIDRTRTVAAITLDEALAEMLPSSGPDTSRHVVNAARLAVAADLFGAAGTMLERAVDYAKVRRQFGRPVGSFQAVKHLCAEMAAELEPARSLLWYAGYALDHDRSDAGLCCLHAKSYLSDAGRFVARTSIEVHGGIGITDELGLHFWFKRIGWNYQAFGAPERMREQAALEQGLIEPHQFSVGQAGM